MNSDDLKNAVLENIKSVLDKVLTEESKKHLTALSMEIEVADGAISVETVAKRKDINTISKYIERSDLI